MKEWHKNIFKGAPDSFVSYLQVTQITIYNKLQDSYTDSRAKINNSIL
jgi:hypothetical protein